MRMIYACCPDTLEDIFESVESDAVSFDQPELI